MMKNTMIGMARALCLALLFAAPGSAADIEQILSFHSDLDIAADGSLTVTETITVNSLGRQIKRGIYRDFPTRYKYRLGNVHTTGLKILSVSRNGTAEPYHVENRSNGKRIYVGHENYLLKPGIAIYQLKYETDRQLGFFRDHDELYWNVTGN